MAELEAKAAASFIADSNVTDLYDEDVAELLPFQASNPNSCALACELKRNALESSNVPPGQCLVGHSKYIPMYDADKYQWTLRTRARASGVYSPIHVPYSEITLGAGGRTRTHRLIMLDQ